MTRLLVDVNVVLDVLLDREPHVASAAALWAEVEKGAASGLVPAHGVTTVHYLAARARDARFARTVVSDILAVFGVAPVGDDVVRRALALDWPDFEDAVCAAAAEAAGCGLIVTRDPGGFVGSPVPVVDPATAVALLAGDDSDRVSEGASDRMGRRRPAKTHGPRRRSTPRRRPR